MKSTTYNFALLLFLLLGSTLRLAAQSNAYTGKVTGLLHSSDGKPLDYATVTLMQAKDSAVVMKTLSAETGGYTFNHVKAGSYVIKVTAVGFNSAAGKPFMVTNGEVTAPALTVQPASKTLSAVTIAGTKALVERHADRLVVNVASSSLAAGNNALDILDKSPGVTVDKDGNISLNGKQGVTVMINDKLTYLSAAQLATLLRSTDGNTIQSIEIMSNPSAKYDAAGNSGIINIKLKKSTQAGTNGSLTLTAGAGRYFTDNSTLNLNHREGKLNVFGTLSRGDRKRYQDINIDRAVTDNTGAATYFNQLSHMTNDEHNNTYRAGADYDISAKNTAGFIVSGYFNPEQDKNDNDTYIGTQPQVISSYQRTLSTVDQTSRNFAFNLNDRYQIDTLGQQLNVDLDYSKFNNGSTALYSTFYYQPDGTATGMPYYLRQLTPSVINIRTAKADYTYPFSKTFKLEAGAKFSNVKTDNDLQALTSSDNVSFVNNTQLSNHFIYTEKIDAGYINLNKEYKKATVQAGLRAEYTSSLGDLVGSTTAPVNRHYLNFFPSAAANYTLNDKNQLGLSYSRRIDRPSYQDLNPFIYYLDQYTYSQGNPFLKPQYTNNFELDYTYNKSVNISLGFAHTTDAITQVLLTNTATKATYQTTINLNSQNAYFLNFNFPYTVTSWWTGEANGSVFYLGFKADSLLGANYSKGKVNYNAKATQTFVIAKSYKFELLTSYESRLIYGLFNISPHYYADAGISHSFADKKANLKLSVSDVFYTLRDNVSSHYQYNDFTIRQRRDSRVARLTFTYNFGNSKIKAPRHQSGADEEKSRVKGGN